MSNAPQAEWPIDEQLVRQLLSAQCPDLAGLDLVHYMHGWDNEMYRLGDHLLVRLPRRERSAPLMTHEIEWVPKLADHVSTYIPRPVFAGSPSEDYPWSWSIVPFAEGVRAADVPLDQRTPAAEGLADFFFSLHTPAPIGAPDNPFRGLSLDQPSFHERVADRLAALPEAALPEAALPDAGLRAALAERWAAWSGVPEWDGPDLWVHGDAHPLNLLLDEDSHELVGVVDWGDITSGDPACDLASAWLTFDAEGRRRFVQRASANPAYDAFVWQRAKAWALYLGLVFVLTSDDAPPLKRVGESAVATLASEPVEQTAP